MSLIRCLDSLYENEEPETVVMVELLEIKNQKQLRSLIQDYAAQTGEEPATCRVLLSCPGSPLATLQALVGLWETAYPDKDLPKRPAPVSAWAFLVKPSKSDSGYERDQYYHSHRFVPR